jgi:hypothetical protein
MNLPVATTFARMDSFAVLREKLRVAGSFAQTTAAEIRALRDRGAKTAGDGRHGRVSGPG